MNTISYIGCDTTCNTGALRESLLLNIYIYSNVSLTDLPCFTRFKFSVHLIYIRERPAGNLYIGEDCSMLKGIRWMTQIVFTNECMHRIKPAGSFGSRMFNFVLQILIQDQGNLFIICFLDVMWISSSKLCCVRKFFQRLSIQKLRLLDRSDEYLVVRGGVVC